MPISVISIAQMRDWEKATWASGQTESEVIRRVGKKIAERAAQLTQPGETILILAGKGNNGKDARATREFLDNRKIISLDVTDPKTALAEFQSKTDEATVSDFPFSNENRRNAYPALIIDGLFGIGLNRALDDDWKRLIAAVNESKISILAVDTPSGLNCETGEPEGAAIEATVTLTVGAPKIGMLAQSAWPFVGRLEVLEDVGLIPFSPDTELKWILPGDFKNFPLPRVVAAHKGSFGYLGIIAGSFGFHGAAVLAARGAQRAQPGRITLFTQENVYHVVASQLQSTMVKLWTPEKNLLDAASAVLIGPGLAATDLTDEIKSVTRRLWRDFEKPMVADASALDWLTAHVLPKGALRVVTPHPGEAARMLNTTAAKVQADRPAALREISRRYGNCWVILKGHQTLIGRNEGEIFVNSSGNPHLAQGGSGDVLSGFIAGFLAQPELQKDIGKTIRLAVWLHGKAADQLQASQKNWIVEDLIPELGRARF